RAAGRAGGGEARPAQRVVERPADGDGCRRLRGASRLARRGLAVLRELHRQREAWARAERRPPFKVVSPDTLVALAAAPPATRAALAGITGLTPRLIERYGDGILDAVARGLAEPLADEPRPDRHPRADLLPEAQQRAERLRGWRATAAERTGLDPGVLLPQRLIDVLAAAPPGSLAALQGVPGLRQWRAADFGPEILAALAGVARPHQP